MNSLLTMKCSYFKYTRLYISLSMPTVSVIYQLSTDNTPSPSAPLPPSLTLQLWTHYSVSLFTCEGSAQLILCELHRGSATHDSLFIMTDVICHTLIYCSKWWTGWLFFSFFQCVFVYLDKLFGSYCLRLGHVRHGDQLCLVSKKVVKPAGLTR